VQACRTQVSTRRCTNVATIVAAALWTGAHLTAIGIPERIEAPRAAADAAAAVAGAGDGGRAVDVPGEVTKNVNTEGSRACASRVRGPAGGLPACDRSGGLPTEEH
jgi:hypothetical protein